MKQQLEENDTNLFVQVYEFGLKQGSCDFSNNFCFNDTFIPAKKYKNCDQSIIKKYEQGYCDGYRKGYVDAFMNSCVETMTKQPLLLKFYQQIMEMSTGLKPFGLGGPLLLEPYENFVHHPGFRSDTLIRIQLQFLIKDINIHEIIIQMLHSEHSDECNIAKTKYKCPSCLSVHRTFICDGCEMVKYEHVLTTTVYDTLYHSKCITETFRRYFCVECDECQEAFNRMNGDDLIHQPPPYSYDDLS